MNAGAEFLLRQAALLEKLFHQRVVRLRDVLDELAVQFLDLRLPLAGRRFLRVFAGAVGCVGDDFVAQHVQHLVEAGAGVDRHIQRKDVPAEMLLRGLHHRVEIHVLLVERVDDDHFRDAVIGRIIPHAVCADAEAVLRVDDDQREIADAQRAQAFADEIQVAGRVNDIEFLSHPFRVQQRG